MDVVPGIIVSVSGCCSLSRRRPQAAGQGAGRRPVMALFLARQNGSSACHRCFLRIRPCVLHRKGVCSNSTLLFSIRYGVGPRSAPKSTLRTVGEALRRRLKTLRVELSGPWRRFIVSNLSPRGLPLPVSSSSYPQRAKQSTVRANLGGKRPRSVWRAALFLLFTHRFTSLTVRLPRPRPGTEEPDA